VTEQRKTKRRFTALKRADRKTFLKHPDNRGFLVGVVASLAAKGIVKSLSTVSRTWNCAYPNPDAAVVAELEAEFQCRRAGRRA
jgi:hypothetical protein